MVRSIVNFPKYDRFLRSIFVFKIVFSESAHPLYSIYGKKNYRKAAKSGVLAYHKKSMVKFYRKKLSHNELWSYHDEVFLVFLFCYFFCWGKCQQYYQLQYEKMSAKTSIPVGNSEFGCRKDI